MVAINIKILSLVGIPFGFQSFQLSNIASNASVKFQIDITLLRPTFWLCDFAILREDILSYKRGSQD